VSGTRRTAWSLASSVLASIKAAQFVQDGNEPASTESLTYS